jgi:hypothetical protein
MTEQGSRSTALHAARDARMAYWFCKRRWRVRTELNYETDDATVRNGEFWIHNGKVFKTPFGNKGTHGYILQEVDPATGNDVWNGKEPSQVSFGWVTIKSAADMFPGSIVEVPPRPYGKLGGVAGALDRQDASDLAELTEVGRGICTAARLRLVRTSFSGTTTGT